MRIMTRVQFMAIPHDVLFSEYEPCFFGPLKVKHQTTEYNDFVEQQIADAIDVVDGGEMCDKLDDSQALGTSVAMDFNCAGRNGLYDPPERLYAVWERADLEQLIAKLQEVLEDMP